MAIGKTEFIDGTYLSYPITVYPQLFAVLDTKTLRSFFAEINKLDGKDGEGMTPEQIVNLFRVGLLSSISDITFEKTAEYVTNYIFKYGNEALTIKLVDAFVDSGLNDRKTVQKNRERVEKNRALRDELDEIRDERNKAILKKCWGDVERLNESAQMLIKELNEASEEAEKEDAKAIEAIEGNGGPGVPFEQDTKTE